MNPPFLSFLYFYVYQEGLFHFYCVLSSKSLCYCYMCFLRYVQRKIFLKKALKYPGISLTVTGSESPWIAYQSCYRFEACPFFLRFLPLRYDQLPMRYSLKACEINKFPLKESQATRDLRISSPGRISATLHSLSHLPGPFPKKTLSKNCYLRCSKWS